jgi:hypothetical protein
MDKGKRQKRLIQKVRNVAKWLRRERVKAKEEGVRFSDKREKRAKKEANHGKLCSCNSFSCGNPRRNIYIKGQGRLTLPERKENERFHEQYDDTD